MSLALIQKYLPSFKEKFLTPPVTRWGRQWIEHQGRVPKVGSGVVWKDYRNKQQLFTDVQLIDHFKASPMFGYGYELQEDNSFRRCNAIYGSYGLALRFSEDQTRAVCIDADKDSFVDLLEEKIVPWFEDRDIDYLWEYSGTLDKPRAHFWFFTETDLTHTNLFFNQLKEECAGDAEWFDEIYPYSSRENALIRLPFGLHLKQMKVNMGNLNGEDFDDLEGAFQAVAEAKVLTQEKLLTFITASAKQAEKRSYPAPIKVLIKDDHLKAPLEDLPDYLHKVSRRCQAVNKVLGAIQDEKLLDLRGQLYHDTGLNLSAWCQYNDHINNENEGEEFFDWACDELRTRTATNHNWKYYWGKQKNINSIISSCATMDKLYNSCAGCPYQGRVSSPKQLYKAEKIVRKKIGPVTIGSLEEIRAKTFPEFDEDILAGKDGDYLLDTIQNSGKSFHADELAVKLMRQGKTVAISCHSAEVAVEHQKRIKEIHGEDAFTLFSFEKIFEHKSNGITCPKETEIKDCIDLGLDSSYFKKKYCKKCPFYDECNYPKQYQELHEDRHKIVILQHAHFSCHEVIRQIFRKGFDVLIIDEYFLDFLITQLKPTEQEISILEEFDDLDWVLSLLKWFKEGGISEGTLKPHQEDLKPILNRFLKEKLDYRIDQFIRLYNDVNFLQPMIGVTKFNPVPEVPIRIILDATADIEELGIILNNPKIIPVKDKIMVDPAIYHPRNKNYKLLDSRTSKSELIGKEKLYEWLEFIGDKMSDEYSDLTALITVFKSAEQDVIEWLMRNYPKIMPRIAVNHMAVGTNAFAKYNVQFLLAGVYSHMIYKELRKEVYKLKFIFNYWARLDDRSTINNPYPTYLEEDASIKWHTEPVKVFHKDGLYEYPQFQVYTPDPNSYDYLIYKRHLSKAQQSDRIRFNQDQVTIKWFIDNGMSPSTIFSDVYLEEELLGKYRTIED